MCRSIFVFSLATCFLLTNPFLLHAIPYRFLASCQPSGHITGTAPKNCNTENNSECCKAGEQYNTYTCSPQVTRNTGATMTLNSFAEGGDGGGPSECDNQYHADSVLVVALSTGWYSGGSRCGKNIRINKNGKSVLAKVVDECDSTKECDAEHAYQPPCGNNIVDASPAMWTKLGYTGNEDDYGETQITWSDA